MIYQQFTLDGLKIYSRFHLFYMQSSRLAKDLQKINSINNYLFEMCTDLQITLPRITFVGSNQIGKTSTIEQLTCLDYLTGIRGHTRRPLEIHFKNSPQLSEPYAQIDQILEDGSPKQWKNFKQIPKQIEKLFFQLQIRRQIGTQPIILRIFSKSTPTITVIDTPGYILGTEFSSHHATCQKIILNYTQSPSTIIIAVLPPTLAHCGRSILQLIHKVDPRQRRTVACVTKIDNMDRGTDAVNILTNQQLVMRHGFVGIKNRSCFDRNQVNEVSLEEGLRQEEKFFKDSRIYSKLPTEILGTAALSKKITTMIYREIKPQLKQILQYINHRKAKIKLQQQNIEPFKQDSSSTCRTVGFYLSKIVKKLEGLMNEISDIKCEFESALMIRDQLSMFLATQYESPATSAITEKQLYHDVIKWPGYNLNFHYLYVVMTILRKLSGKSKQFIPQIYSTFKEAIQRIVKTQNNEFQSIIEQMILSQMEKNYMSLSLFVQQLFKSESYLFTNNSDYFNENFHICKRTGKPNTFERQFRQRVDSYLHIVIINLRETVPKQIINFLLNKTIKQLQEKLIKQKQINKSQRMASENPKIFQRQLEQLNSLESIITHDPEMMDIIGTQDQIFDVEQPSKTPQIKTQNMKVKQSNQKNLDFAENPRQAKNDDKPKIEGAKTEEAQKGKLKKTFNDLFGL